MREQRLRALAVRLPAVDPAAAGHPDGYRCREIARRPIAQARRLGDDLVGRRIKVVGELDFNDRSQPVGTHADRGADDTALGNGGVKHPLFAVFLLQPFCAAKNTAKVADILAINHHLRITREHHVHRRAQSLNHRHRSLARAHGRL